MSICERSHNKVIGATRIKRSFTKSLFVICLAYIISQFLDCWLLWFVYLDAPGPVSIWRPSFPGMWSPMLKIRRSRDRLIFNMGIPIQIRRYLNIEAAPWLFHWHVGNWRFASVQVKSGATWRQNFNRIHNSWVELKLLVFCYYKYWCIILGLLNRVHRFFAEVVLLTPLHIAHE